MAWSLPEGSVLGIFGKKPEAGRVKTRLAAAFGPEAAAEIHEAMLFDLVATWSSEDVLAPGGGGRRVLVFSPGDAGPWFDARVPAAFALQPQVEGDLGERMQAFFAGEFADGATRVVLIGADAPTLDPTLVISAFLCLEGRDVVLGPATDGGYYLVGSRHAEPPIFEGVDWSTPDVLGQTIDRLRDTGLSLAVLPPWYDVDTPDDWRVLAGHIRALRRAGMDPRLPRTEALLERSEPFTTGPSVL
jgi:rSAM/selenodomain-associated transferase 1